jgi:hypothetical protein
MYVQLVQHWGAGKIENGTFSKPVKEIVTFICNKNISLQE